MATGLELVLRLLVVVGTADVEPVVIRSPCLHRLSRGDQPQNQIREVEPLARLDQLDARGAKQYTPIDTSKSNVGFSL